MNIQLSKSVTAYQAADRKTGTEPWVIVEDRVELLEVPASSVLCDALNALALYADFFRAIEELTWGKHTHAQHIDLHNYKEVLAAKINALNEGASIKSDWSNKL